MIPPHAVSLENDFHRWQERTKTLRKIFPKGDRQLARLGAVSCTELPAEGDAPVYQRLSHVEGMSTTRDGSALVRIRSAYPALKPAERKVADFILANPEAALRLSISDLAAASRTSEATVTRFCQGLDFRGFQQMKAILAIDLLTPSQAYEQIQEEDDETSVAEKVLKLTIRGLQDTLALLGPTQIRRAVDVLLRARKVDCYGNGGASSAVASLTAHKLLNLGVPCVAITDSHMQAASAALLKPGDVAFGISHSGEGQPVVRALRLARQAGATTVCLTNYLKSSITEVSDVHLFTAAVREAPIFGEAITSRAVQLGVLDVLYSAIALRKYQIARETDLSGARSAGGDRPAQD